MIARSVILNKKHVMFDVCNSISRFSIKVSESFVLFLRVLNMYVRIREMKIRANCDLP